MGDEVEITRVCDAAGRRAAIDVESAAKVQRTDAPPPSPPSLLAGQCTGIVWYSENVKRAKIAVTKQDLTDGVTMDPHLA